MSEAVENQEAARLPSTDDPRKFLAKFKESTRYKETFDQYFSGKTLSEDTTGEDKDKAFWESDVAKVALLDFGQKDLHLHYNSEQYAAASRKAVEDYIATVEDSLDMMREGATAHQIATLDGMRFLNHVKLARALVKDGIAPTEKIGRALGRLILIDKHLDTFDSAREPDIKRLERRIGV